MDIYSFLRHKMEVFFSAHDDAVPPRDVYKMVVDEVERAVIDSTMEYVNYNKSKASEIIGINRNTLYKKCSDLRK